MPHRPHRFASGSAVFAVVLAGCAGSPIPDGYPELSRFKSTRVVFNVEGEAKDIDSIVPTGVEETSVATNSLRVSIFADPLTFRFKAPEKGSYSSFKETAEGSWFEALGIWSSSESCGGHANVIVDGAEDEYMWGTFDMDLCADNKSTSPPVLKIRDGKFSTEILLY